MMKAKNEVDFLTYIELDGFDKPDILESSACMRSGREAGTLYKRKHEADRYL
jgi:hypothetical protein